MKTTRRLHGAVCLGAAILTGALLAGCGGGGGGGVDITPPAVTNFAATPATLDFAGGRVTLSVHVSDPSGVGTVNAAVYSSNEVDTLVVMSSTGGGNYSGTFSALPNPSSSGSAVVYTAILTATDRRGNSTSTEPFTVTVTAPDEPPDEPE